jgi:DNA-binding MarR family transcriptional regulator
MIPRTKIVGNAHTQETPDDTCSGDDFYGSFMHVIHMLYIGVQKHLEQALITHKQVSFSQFVILVGFSSTCGQSDTTQVKLAEHLMLTEATVSRHITALVGMKLLSKKKHPKNKKSYNLALTTQGTKTFLSAKKIIMKELDVLFSHITEKDREIIIKNFITTLSTLQQKK